ncbi:MAG: alpha/beta hydrolase [Rhodobacteraceae bacterium]|nr:alpha/beta hydrolase [Paracoccaceae bacterium]
MGEVYYRQTGAGNGVICIHGSLSSSRQWLMLMNQLSDRYEVFAPDLHGYGKSPIWPDHRKLTVDDEVNLLAPVFAAAKDNLNIIGHSWGGAVALKAALKYRKRLRSLVLFEPALWSLLTSAVPDSPATQEISQIRSVFLRDMENGNWRAAAENFLNYWAGPGTWQKLNEKQREETLVGMPAVQNNWLGSFNDPTQLARFTSIEAPVLLLTGSRSPHAARTLVEALASTLRKPKVVVIDDAGHMGPITHADQVNQIIESFLENANRGIHSCHGRECTARNGAGSLPA